MPTLTLTSNVPDGTGLHRLTFDRALEGFVSPGQFVTVTVGDLKPGYFALASVPGAPTELLIKASGDVAEALVAMSAGDPVEVSDPIGKGFQVTAGDPRHLIVLATGSGISAVRSVIEAEVAAGLRRPVTLLYGVFTPAHRSYVERLEAWSAAGVTVHLVYSEPVDGWDGATGFVQQAVVDLGLVDKDATVVLCGFPGMVEDAKKLWIDVGATPDQLLTNF